MLFRSFEEHHQDFIRDVRAGFMGISGHYKVELPVSEIAYIYDYINMNLKNKAAGLMPGNSSQEDE